MNQRFSAKGPSLKDVLPKKSTPTKTFDSGSNNQLLVDP